MVNLSTSGLIFLTIFAIVNSQNVNLREQPPVDRPRIARQRSVVQGQPTTPPPIMRHGNGEIEYRLARLEILLVEKLENLRAEVRDTNRRLQTLEMQSSEAHTELESVRQDLNRLVEQPPTLQPVNQAPASDNQKLEIRIENLAKGLQILVAATRGLTSDVNGLKKNVSTLITSSRSLVQATSQLVTKQFFNNGLLDLKHHQIGNHFSSNPSISTATSTNFKNCKDVQNSGQTQSGIYLIQPEQAEKPFIAVCDFDTEGGGWTVFQNRFDGSQDFFQNYHEYKNGFGNLKGEFWLGLEKLHRLTGSETNELLIELEDFNSTKKSALYSTFSIGSEVEGYSLKVLGDFGGDAGDSLIYHAGNRFTTRDVDQDSWPEGNCAQLHFGGWWYKSCDQSNLNGQYLKREVADDLIYQGMYWGEFHGAQYSLRLSRMLVRPREEITSLLIDEIFNNRNDHQPSRNTQNNGY